MIIQFRKRQLAFGAFLMVAALLAVGGAALPGDSDKVTHIATDHKVIALTIDDGPHYKTTPEILEVLKAKNVHVTFFILGENAAENVRLLAKEVADGHEVAVHAYHHQLLTKLDKVHINKELDETEAVLQKVSAAKPKLFRPPGGFYNDAVVAAARERGYSMILWNIDPRDWARPSVDDVVETILSKASPGSIVLLHDGQYPLPTPKALGIIIDRLRAQGYEFRTVSELLHEMKTAGSN